MPRKLKVFRTAVGFRDAYVAAPSRAAALRAWGTGKDLFARGSAEEVTDPALTGEALAKPGEGVYRTRGGLKEQVAALGPLPKRKPAAAKAGSPSGASPASSKPKSKPAPRPSRKALDAAQAAVEALAADRDHAERDMRERERKLAQERATMEKRYAKKLADLQRDEDRARRDYEEALRLWEP